MKTLALVIPCHNEAKRLDLQAFIEATERWQWLSFCFVDDGSTDSTASKLAHLANLSPVFHAIYLEKNVGKAEAVRRGMMHICENTHADCAGFWDADLATPLEAIPSFMRQFEEYGTLKGVIGSRWPHLGTDIQRSPLRSIAGAVVKFLIRQALGVQVWDTQCGAKIFTRETAGRIFRAPFRTRWLFDVELLARLGRTSLGTEIREIPLEQWHDIPGSKVGFRALAELAFLPSFYSRYRKHTLQ